MIFMKPYVTKRKVLHAKTTLILAFIRYILKMLYVAGGPFLSGHLQEVSISAIQALMAEIKGVFSRSQCCYGNLLCHKNNTNVFTSDWAVF